MRSRVISTSKRATSWKTWLLQDYTRYWYGLGVILLLVFGVAEVARIGAPLGAIQVAGLLLLCIAIVAGGVVGYLLLWRRDTATAQGILRAVLRRRWSPVAFGYSVLHWRESLGVWGNRGRRRKPWKDPVAPRERESHREGDEDPGDEIPEGHG